MKNEKTIQGKITWQSPSNIALVKYWGKHGIQLPRNPSLSFTLKNAFTQTTLSYSTKEKSSSNISLEFLFEGEPNPAFQKKIAAFLQSISSDFPFLKTLDLKIESQNSFPHSTGIASSASAMSALALCLCTLEEKVGATDREAFLRRASHFARLGSGSASRSVFAEAAIWGQTTGIKESSDEYAIPLPYELHPVFKNYQDTILIVSSETKKTSSRAGHALMEGNPFAEVRYQQANRNLEILSKALQNDDLETFGEIVEAEALALHALMMCSSPSFILMKPNTLTILDKIREYRKESRTPVYFTLDAGPNVHVLYPFSEKEKVSGFIESELKPLCENGKIIYDEMGQGARQIFDL